MTMVHQPQPEKQQTTSLPQWWVSFDDVGHPIQHHGILAAGGPLFLAKRNAAMVPATTIGHHAHLRRVLVVPDDDPDVDKPHAASTTRVTADDLRRADA